MVRLDRSFLFRTGIELAKPVDSDGRLKSLIEVESLVSPLTVKGIEYDGVVTFDRKGLTQ